MKTYIQLGRAGDILNILPLLYADWRKTETKSALMVAAEFASLIEGVTYVEPIIYDGPHYEIAGAVARAQAEGRDWVCTQVNGPIEQVAEHVYRRAGMVNAVTTSYQKEMWRIAGRLKDWDSKPPLVFDNRDPRREQSTMSRHLPKHKPFILVASSGNSSPFPYVPLLVELLKLKFKSRYDIIDLKEVKAERLFDLLYLYERAYCLVAIDSAPLHLARSCPSLPVVALTNDTPLLWNGSSWQPEHIWYCRYSDFPNRATGMLEAIETMPERLANGGTRIVHIWNAYQDGAVYLDQPWLSTPIELGACGRDSANILKDPKRYPFLRDCLRMGLQRARDNDYICLTRPGTKYRPGINNTLFQHEAAYAYRVEIDSSGGEEFKPIVDLFFARRGWWQNILPEIPDLVLGGDYFWSHTLWGLFSQHKASDVTGCVWRIPK